MAQKYLPEAVHGDKRIVLVQKTADGAIYVDEFAKIVEERTHGPTVGAALYG